MEKKYNTDLLTTRGFACLIFVMVFACVRLPPAFSTQSKPCFRGWTGPDTGGSCTFHRGNLCDWTNSKKDEFDWVFRDSPSSIFLNNYYKYVNDRALLVGPIMCEIEGSDVCLTIKYKSAGSYGAELSMSICDNGFSEDGCNRQSLRLWYTRDWDGDIWNVQDIDFKSPGRFQMLIEGKKHADRPIVTEADAYIQFLEYKNLPCKDLRKVAPVTKLATLRTTLGETILRTTLGVTTVRTTLGETTVRTTLADTGSITQQTTLTAYKAMEEKTSSSLMIPVVVAVVLAVVACAVVTVIAIWRRRSRATHAARNEQNDMDAAECGDDSVSYDDINNGDGSAPSGDINDGDGVVPHDDINNRDGNPPNDDISDGGGNVSYDDINNGDDSNPYDYISDATHHSYVNAYERSGLRVGHEYKSVNETAN